MERNDCFTVVARRCKRCGGILINEKAVKDGYGHVCKQKAILENIQKQPMENQIDMFTYFKDKKYYS